MEVMKIKKLFYRSASLFLAVPLALSLPVTAFAQATPSQASYTATPSNAVYDDFIESMDHFSAMDDFYFSDTSMLMSDGEGNITSSSNGTVSDYSQLYVDVSYWDSTNTRRKYRRYCDSNGYFSIPALGDVSSSPGLIVDFVVPSRALPPSGTYLAQLHFSSNTGGFTYATNSSAFVGKDIKNAESVGINAVYDSFSQSSGDFTASKIVNLAGANYLFFRVQPSQSLTFPYGGYITWSFKPTNSSNALTTPTTGNVSNDSGSVSSSEIADNTAAIIEGQETIIETIREQIQYIIFQIQAFWNQLAGEFTNLFSKLNDHHQEDLDAWQENTSIIVDGMDSNTTNIINNDNANTEKVVNGYDNSSINSDNDRLKDTLGEYDTEEGKVMENVNDSINSFDFDTDFDSYLEPIKTVSDFLQALYENSGGFKAVINVAFAVTIASLVIGIYRFKGGG